MDLIEHYKQLQIQNGNGEVDWYYVLKYSTFWYSLPSITKYWIFCVMGEGLSIFYSFFIGYIIEFLEDPKAEKIDGIWLVVVFFCA